MRDSLGGTAKTLMFVNVSPSCYNEAESNNSMDYATRVKKIKNNVNKNVETTIGIMLKKQINDLEKALDGMKDLLLLSDKKE